MHIGKRVKKFRMKGEIRCSQARFAALIGVSQPYVSALENETVQPSKNLLRRIEKTMNILAESEKAATEARNRTLAGLAVDDFENLKMPRGTTRDARTCISHAEAEK
jgi:transcriptional regulator with XRE-family HTH domain